MTTVVRLVIRLIRSFLHKNIRTIILREDLDGFDLTNTTVEDLMTLVRKKLLSDDINPPLPPPFKAYNFDCMKVGSYISKINIKSSKLQSDYVIIFSNVADTLQCLWNGII